MIRPTTGLRLTLHMLATGGVACAPRCTPKPMACIRAAPTGLRRSAGSMSHQASLRSKVVVAAAASEGAAEGE